MSNRKAIAIIYAVMAAVFYAINMPLSKILLGSIPAVCMAGLLYLGAGIGMGILFLGHMKTVDKGEFLTREDLPYTVGMVVLDIAAPICLMYGLEHTTSANASLLNNFEIAATAVIALVIFGEAISKRLCIAIILVTISSILLSLEDISGLQFSWGSLLVLLAAVCWGFENNCTRKISSKNTYEIVTIKGICSGLGSLVTAVVIKESFPEIFSVLLAMLLGFVAYGLSIFFYIKAQHDLGAAKTSAYYAIAPFVGAFLSFLLLKEPFSLRYLTALLIMILGTVTATVDTLILHHQHLHTHTITHTHDGSTHTHQFTHSHDHKHFLREGNHEHTHSAWEEDHFHLSS
ncbi:MAG: DMT family transporter [Clostridiales bacterium]|nr:DMT family transporter [Clostridiales bacterium]